MYFSTKLTMETSWNQFTMFRLYQWLWSMVQRELVLVGPPLFPITMQERLLIIFFRNLTEDPFSLSNVITRTLQEKSQD
jgi:hypothetical protein